MVKHIKYLTFQEVVNQNRLPEFIKLTKRKLRDKLKKKYEDKTMRYFIENNKLEDFIELMQMRITEIEKYRTYKGVGINARLCSDIRTRGHPHDVFITPKKLAKTHIDMIYKISNYNDKLTWYDPFKGTGNYYNQFPHVRKYWTEISEGRDFFKTKGKVDVIISNPP
jgi:hypothetical protein